MEPTRYWMINTAQYLVEGFGYQHIWDARTQTWKRRGGEQPEGAPETTRNWEESRYCASSGETRNTNRLWGVLQNNYAGKEPRHQVYRLSSWIHDMAW